MKSLAVGTILFLFLTGVTAANDLPYATIKACYYKSYAAEQAGKYQAAIDTLDPVYRHYPDTYTVNLRIGWLCYLDKKYPEALMHLKKALAVSPASFEAINIATLLQAAREDWKRVEQQSMRILKMDNYNQNANYWYSHALRMQQKYEQAIVVDRKMLAVYPTSFTFLQELGENLHLSGQKEKSRSIFSDLLILSPGNKVALQYLQKMADGANGVKP